MVQAESKTLTLEEFLKLPETKPASEYINGRVIQKPMPQGKHSRIQGELVSAINFVVKQKKIACAFPELRCTFGGRSTIPDIAVFVWSRIPCDENGEIANTFSQAPDWTIEILSPSQSHTRVTKNILHCLKHGTQMGWLIDPEEKTVLVYRPKKEIELFDEPDALLRVPPFVSELNITVEDLFSWLVL
ncbi:MAG: Uma2 family endonuclease [Xenococcus sp. (in: cyanobacteria)]